VSALEPIRVERIYGPYRDAEGERTIVQLEMEEKDDGTVAAHFTGAVYAKHSSYWHSGGQVQGSAPQKLKDLWTRWHLNDMRAGCEHQRALGWTSYAEHPAEPCPECGYKFGSAWLFEPLPPGFISLCDSAAGR